MRLHQEYELHLPAAATTQWSLVRLKPERSPARFTYDALGVGVKSLAVVVVRGHILPRVVIGPQLERIFPRQRGYARRLSTQDQVRSRHEEGCVSTGLGLPLVAQPRLILTLEDQQELVPRAK
jgi:hypothetical protein